MAKRKMSKKQKAALAKGRKKLKAKRKISSSKPKRSRAKVNNVAKKKRTYRKSRSSSIVSGLTSELGAGLVYGAAQPFVDQQLSKVGVNTADELTQIVAALVLKQFLGRKGGMLGKVVKNYSNAAIIVNTASLTRTLVAGRFGSSSVGSTSSGNGLTVYA